MKILNKQIYDKHSIDELHSGDIVLLTFGCGDLETWYAIVGEIDAPNGDFVYIDVENGEIFQDIECYDIIEIYRNSEITIK